MYYKYYIEKDSWCVIGRPNLVCILNINGMTFWLKYDISGDRHKTEARQHKLKM